MPLDRRLLLLGPPGTGKTTTLIRRLAQKRTPEGLTDEEAQLLSATGLQPAFAAPESWAMFSPTELLSLYLRESFNREGVPATEGGNLRTWERERLDLARNVLGILRSADSGVFQLDEAIATIVDASSNGISRVFDEFQAFVERVVADRTTMAFRDLAESKDEAVLEALTRLRRVLGVHDQMSLREIVLLLDAAPEILQPAIRRLDEQVSAEVDRAASRLLAAHNGLLEDVSAFLSEATEGATQPDEEDDDIDDEESDVLPISRDARIRALGVLFATIRSAARAAALGRSRVSGRAGRVLDLLGTRRPPPQELEDLGAIIVTRARLRIIRQAPWQLVMGVPRLYATFRRETVTNAQLFTPLTSEVVRQGRISPAETDIVILVMLRNSRVLAATRGVVLPAWLEAITARYLAQVFIDEATDFSAVQLACTMELTYPRVRSWFACGDLLQRVTEYGIQDLSELDFISGDGSSIEVHEVRIGYRQAQRLRDLAAALARGQGPAIDRVNELVGLTRPFLESRNVRIAGSPGGRIVGDVQEVRVFDIRHIKGLEFEAVFFVGIDRLAQRLPTLFDRYLYVGVTRAATYLGLTCETTLPAAIEPLRRHFGNATTHAWS
jgi:hypothetical protein